MIAKGQIVVFTAGTHDDYRIEGIYRAVQDIDVDGRIKEYVASDSYCKGRGWGHEDRFVLWLAQKGLIVPTGSAAKEQYICANKFHGV